MSTISLKSDQIRPRLFAIDQVRALAIISMMIAHFGPGVLERTPSLMLIYNEIMFLGKFATVMFVTIFGVVIGYVYYNQFWERDRSIFLYRLRVRTALLVACAIAICIPNYVSLYVKTDFILSHWLHATYSVLNFYVLAVATAPLWLKVLGKNPTRNALLLGVAYWVVGIFLLSIWAPDENKGLTEYARINLVSGPYAYFQLSAWTLIAVPIGLKLQRGVRIGQQWNVIRYLLPIGIALAIGGWALGYVAGEFDLQAIVSGALKSPPRFWYWMFFSGPALLTLIGLVALEARFNQSRRVLYPLTLFGQGALPIYTAHAFVLPALALLDLLFIIEGSERILMTFTAFGLLCLAVMYWYHLKGNLRRISRSAGEADRLPLRGSV